MLSWLRANLTSCAVVAMVLFFIAPGGSANEAAPEGGIGLMKELEARSGSASGIAFFPATLQDGEVSDVQDPAGFEVVFTSAESPGAELRFDAGTFLQPPAGRWRVWLEGEEHITPFTDLFVFRGNWPAGRVSFQTLPVVPAGRVRVSPALEGREDLELRLLYVEPSAAGSIRVELSRRWPASTVGSGIVMPAGKVIAGLWDQGRARYIAFSRPFSVSAGEATVAPLMEPQTTEAHLLVYLGRPDGASGAVVEGLEVFLSRDGRRLDPDARLLTVWGAYAFWFGLAPGGVSLRAGNDQLYLESTELVLRGGQVTRWEKTLERRPFLD